MDLTIVATYRFRHEADLAIAVLAANDIDAMIAADDAGGYRPEIMSAVRVLVRTEHVEAARMLLTNE